MGAALTLGALSCEFDGKNLVRAVTPWLACLFFLLCSFRFSSLVFVRLTLGELSLDLGMTNNTNNNECTDLTTDYIWLFDEKKLMIVILS